MKTSKVDQPKSKTPYNSKHASKFLEKEGLNSSSLIFKGLATSLNDFIPIDNETVRESTDIDFDIGNQMKKLEKKDTGTKQKALMELIDLVNTKDVDSVISMLRYWPKLYNRLSVDEDKKIRELSQEMMGNLARICGKNIGSHIKQLLPTWIFAQSDAHGAAATLATASFQCTFPDDFRRKKAYLLCWNDISSMIGTSLMRSSNLTNKEVQGTKKEVVDVTKVSNREKKKEASSLTHKSEMNCVTTESTPIEQVTIVASKDSPALDAYINDIVLHLRTLTTLIPHIINDDVAMNDLIKWLNSKQFWNHYKISSHTRVIAVYLTLSIEILTHVPQLIVDTPFIVGHLSQALRLIDNYHASIVPLVWTVIIKCIDVIGLKLWQHVSFTGSFLPKWIRMLECAVEGRMSLVGSFMLPFFTKMPMDLVSSESMPQYSRIFEAMIKGLVSPRVKNNSQESNCFATTILECATYVVIGARASSNENLKEKVLCIIWRLLENHMTDNDYSKADKTVTQFCGVALRPLVNKTVVTSPQLIDILVSWVDKYHDKAFFAKKLTEMLIELDTIQIADATFCPAVMDVVQLKLLNYIVQKQLCILPYLAIISSKRYLSPSLNECSELKDVFLQCNQIMVQHDAAVMTTISFAMANILSSIPEDPLNLYHTFLHSLSTEQTILFFQEYYGQFIEQVSTDINVRLADESLSFWKSSLFAVLNASVQEHSIDIPYLLPTVLQHCRVCSLHHDHLSQILQVLDLSTARTTEILVTSEGIDMMIAIWKYCIQELHAHFTVALMPRSMVLNLVKMLLSISSKSKPDLSHLRTYLQHGCVEDVAIFTDILNELLLSDGYDYEAVADVVALVVQAAPPVHRQKVLLHIERLLLDDMVSIDDIVLRQQRYSISVVHQQQHHLVTAMHKIIVLLQLNLDQLRTSVSHACTLLSPVLLATFSNCHYSTELLQQCDLVYKHSTVMTTDDTVELMLISTQSGDSGVAMLDRCVTLVTVALRHHIPTNYSQWTHSVLSSMDLALHSWTDASLSRRQLSLVFDVLVPCALRARYFVQEVVLATISSLLSAESGPNLGNINRATLLIKSLVTTDPSFFPLCLPLLLTVKHQFEGHMDQLYDASLDKFSASGHFDLSSLLEILIAGVESSSSLTQAQWDFVLCLVSTLCRSTQFVNSGDYAVDSVTDDTDHIFNSHLLLRLIAAVTVSLASVRLDTVLDEWDNFFSERIFTTVLDMFSLLSGDHTHGRLVTSPLFPFYREALAEVVSLCPVNVLLGHSFCAQIHVNDPIELPKQVLTVLNSLLESLSSYSLSTQLAAYNCLLNLTETLSGLLLDQITTAETNDTLESFSITLPHKLLAYLNCDHLTQLTADKLENEVVVTRCCLAWSVLLQLFSCSQAKVRAEVSSFLVTHERLFDKFLSFCFAFMPHSPLVHQRHISFLVLAGRQSCNLIAEEPQIFSRCLDRRTKFLIYHLASFVFRRGVQVLPNLTRCWFLSLDVSSQQQVDVYVRQFITPELFKIEFEQLKEAVSDELDERLEIHARPVIGEVAVRYIVPGDQCLEQVVTLPSNYPIGKVAVDFKSEMKVKIAHWKSWIIQMTATMQNQNGSVLDGVKLWKKNLDNHFDGVEECMICYSILHATKYTVPSMKCRQCKKKFHKDCMYKWFQSSTNPTCPNCRNVFYDGTYKRTQYGTNDN